MLVLVAGGDVKQVAPETEPTTIAGELVIPVDSCSCNALCRCRRSWFGIASGGTTPTALVAERAGVSAAELRHVVADQLARICGRRVDDSEVDAALDQIRSLTEQFPNGACLARVGDHVTEVQLAVGE
jgi:hypothetical protein